MNALVYVKMLKMKNEKLLGFSFYIDIGNFEAILRNLNFSAKHLFWRCFFVIALKNRGINSTVRNVENYA